MNIICSSKLAVNVRGQIPEDISTENGSCCLYSQPQRICFLIETEWPPSHFVSFPNTSMHPTQKYKKEKLLDGERETEKF